MEFNAQPDFKMDNQTDENANTNLIINYLPQSLTDEDFRAMFISVGPIKSSKIIRDKQTGYSYGFGFVNFERPEDAQRAIETLTGLQLQQKRIKVALARPSADNIKGANLYVRGLPTTWKEEQLNKFFDPYGKIIMSKVLVDMATGNSKKVGFVLYDTRDEAENAMKQCSGKTPEGSTEPIMIKFADDQNKKNKQQQVQFIPVPNFAGPGPMRNQMNRFQRFNPMGNMGGGMGGMGGGMGGGNFNGNNFNMGGMGGMGGMGQMGNMGGGGGGGGPTNGYTLFVYNIGFNATDNNLWQLFSPFGTVQKVNIITDREKQQCKGFGFVTMTNLKEAENAINCLNGYFYNGRILQVSLKSPKDGQQQGNQ